METKKKTKLESKKKLGSRRWILKKRHKENKSDKPKPTRPIGEKISLIIQFIIVPIALILIGARIFSVRVAERNAIRSAEAEVSRHTGTIGSEGYGVLSSIEVNVGDYVEKGEVVYTYTNTKLDERIFQLESRDVEIILDDVEDGVLGLNDFNRNLEFSVHSPKAGYVSDIVVPEGSYVTREEKIMEIEYPEAFIEATLALRPNDASKLKRGSQVQIEVSPGKIIKGQVHNIYPQYDSEKNTIKVDVTIDEEELESLELEEFYTGSPVTLMVIVEDKFSTEYRRFIDRIPFKFVRDFLSHEPSI